MNEPRKKDQLRSDEPIKKNKPAMMYQSMTPNIRLTELRKRPVKKRLVDLPETEIRFNNKIETRSDQMRPNP